MDGDLLPGGIRLIRCLGSGGFGSVWLAQGEDGRSVAAKILHFEHQEAPVVRRRFADEARILGSLHHPNVPALIRSALDEKPPHLLLEYVHGEDLRTRLVNRAKSDHQIPLSGVAWIAGDVGAALAHAHGHGVVHRDLKPANILVNFPHQRPLVKVLDFGVAKTLSLEEHERTTKGRQLGSLMYMAPEQIVGDEISAATDTFALGAIVFELLTLRRAWAVDDSGDHLPFHLQPGLHNRQFEVLERIARRERPSACRYRPDVPEAVDEVLRRALAPDPADRFSSIERMIEALRVAVLDVSRDARRLLIEDTTEELPSLITQPVDAPEGEESGA